jgi:hypothetical protein
MPHPTMTTNTIILTPKGSRMVMRTDMDRTTTFEREVDARGFGLGLVYALFEVDRPCSEW